MFGYYLDLAVRSLKRNKVLTALMVLSLGLGIGASITTLTVLKLLSDDPIPGKSARLFYPQIDPLPKQGYVAGQTQPQTTLSYTDAMNLLHSRRARRQAVLALSPAKIVPAGPDKHPFFTRGVITTSDFFALFDVPFRYGDGWNREAGEGGAHVAVIAGFLNDKLFGGGNSIGKTIRINDHDYRIVGVLQPWHPQPRFYAVNLGGQVYGDADAVFVPMEAALADGFRVQGRNCWSTVGMHDLKTSKCMWIGMWVELDAPSDAAAYKRFLANYARQQIALGRMERPEVALPDLMQYLVAQQVVPNDVRIQTWLAFGFLLICVVNTVGLLLAKCLRRSREIGVRRALGATRRTIFAQFMVESAMVGLAGGVLGLILAELGLFVVRHQPAQYAGLAHLDVAMFVATFVIALIASLVAGVLPAWRACVIAPAPQLKDA